MRKKIALLLALITALGLTACGDNSANAGTEHRSIKIEQSEAPQMCYNKKSRNCRFIATAN